MWAGGLGAGAQAGEDYSLLAQQQQQHITSVEALLDEAKTSNRLLSRALAAVQVSTRPCRP